MKIEDLYLTIKNKSKDCVVGDPADIVIGYDILTYNIGDFEVATLMARIGLVEPYESRRPKVSVIISKDNGASPITKSPLLIKDFPLNDDFSWKINPNRMVLATINEAIEKSLLDPPALTMVEYAAGLISELKLEI